MKPLLTCRPWPVLACHRLLLVLTLPVFPIVLLPAATAQKPPAMPAKAVPVGNPTVDGPPDVLMGDPRLEARVTLSRRDVTVEEALNELTKQTHVNLAAQTSKIPGLTGRPGQAIAVAVKDVPLRDVLRALAAIFNDHWTRAKMPDGQDGLLLVDFLHDPRWISHPRDQAQADKVAAMLSFTDAAARLPADVRQALAADTGGVPYASLPPAMQQAAQDALRSLTDSPSVNPAYKPPADYFDSAKVRFKGTPNDFDQTTQYTLGVSGPGANDKGSLSLSVGMPLPDDPLARDAAVTVPPADFVPWQVTQLPTLIASFNAARDRAAKDDPRLAQPVSLKTDDCSVGYPLVALADTAHVPIIAEVLPQTHTVSFGPLPLHEAFDRIASKYGGAWTVTREGVVVFHILARLLPHVMTPAEKAASDAIDTKMREQRREEIIRNAPPGVPLTIDGVPVIWDSPPGPAQP